MEIIEDDVDFSLYDNRGEWHKIRRASDWKTQLQERIESPEEFCGDTLPWQKMEGFRLRKSEVTVWAGINGHGKSMLLSHVMLHQMKSHEKRVVIASMEMTPVKTMERMLRQDSGGSSPTIQYAEKFSEWTNGKLWIYDHLGMVNADKMLAVVRYSISSMKCDHFVIDSLMKCGIQSDNYNGQKEFLNELCGIALETGVHIHLVAHARKGERETNRLDKFDIKGASEITDQVDNVVLIHRNKMKENDKTGKLEDEPDAFVAVAKQRHGDWEGTAGLWFDRESMAYSSSHRRVF